MSKTPDALRRISLLALVFILFISAINQCFAATNEGYGEDQTSLGQSIDSFENLDNVSVRVLIERNSTLNAMELNFSSDEPLLQNYTEYTEVDPGNDIDRFLRNVTWTDLIRNIESYVYIDRGAGNIDNFQYNFTFTLTDATDGAGQNLVTFTGLSNGIGSFADTLGNDWLGLVILSTAVNDQLRFRILQYTGGVLDFSAIGVVRNIGTFYITFNRTGTAIVARIYSNPIRNSTFLLETLTDGGNGAGTNYRYQYAVQSWDSAVVPNARSSGAIIDLWNMTGGVSGYVAEGYFTTVDYLADPLANGSALVAMVITEIPANTDIQLQFSNDTVTWTDNEGVIGDSMDLLGGSESIDLRLLNHSNAIEYRFNLSTTDPSVTPRVNQSRLITTIGQGVGPGVLNGSWVYYNLTAILNITGVHDDGFLNSTYFIDGDTWNCSEVVGAPGYQVNFNATGIDPEAISLWLVSYVLYDGTASHEVNVELWNFTSSAFVELGEIPDMLTFAWMNFTVYGMRVPLDFLNSTGAIVGRFYHMDAGNINHNIIFDRINILAFVPTGLAVGGGGVNRPTILIIVGLLTICAAVFIGVKKR